MGLVAIAETAEMIGSKQAALSVTEKEFVLQFAFSTGDKELTNKLIDELVEEDADKWAVLQKYSVLMEPQPDWIRKIENLLVALEMYRMQEEKAMQSLSELLAAFGVDLTVDELKEMPADKVREQLEKKEALIR